MAEKEKVSGWDAMWECIQNIAIKAIGDFWLLLIVPACIPVAIFWLIPDQEKVPFLKDILFSNITAWSGWFAAFGLMVAWLIQFRWTDSRHKGELDRIATLRNDAQQKIAGVPFNSSNDKA